MKLTKGEALEVVRRRRRMTQDEMADTLGVTVHRYRRWEHDRGLRSAPRLDPGDLDPPEWCFVARRRSKLTMLEVAMLTGFPVGWLQRAERGEVFCVDKLVHWWKTQGGNGK